MEIQVENRVDIEPVTDVEIAASNVAEVSVADDTALDVSVVKKEYKIVGDEVYIAKLYDDAPQWMKDLVQLVVDNTMASESTALLNDLVSQLNKFATSYVPLNTYTQSILDLSNADQSLHANLETLNSNFNDGLNTANSQIINLALTKASKDEVTTKVVETLAAQLFTPTSELGAIIGNLQQAIVDGDSANADSITTLTSSLEGEVDARAAAVSALTTRVSNVEGTTTSQAAAITNLTTELNNGTTTWAAADSSVVNSLTTTISNGDAAVQAKWAYNSTVAINGVYKKSGFGLTSNYSSGSGTVNDPYLSEFWIDATKLKFTNSNATGRTAPFTIDASGTTPQITFNGKVSFSNVTGAPGGGSNLLYNSAPMVANETKGWSVGWYNTGITPILGAGFDPWRPSSGGSVYAAVPGAPAIGTAFDVAQTTKVPVIGGMWYEASAYISSHRCTSYVTIAWYDSNNTYINEVGGSQVAVAAGGALVNWSRSTLLAQAPANAARAHFYIRSIVNSTDPYCFVAFAYLGRAVQGQAVLSDWSEGTSAGVSSGEVVNDINNGNTTTIDGSKITTGSIGANQITANISITSPTISGGVVSGTVINGGTINGGTINGVNINGAVIKASWIDYSSTGTLTNWAYYTPVTMPAQYATNFAHNSSTGALITDSNGFVRLPKVSKVIIGSFLYNVGSTANVSTLGNVSFDGYDLDIRSFDNYTTTSTRRLLNANTRIVFDSANIPFLTVLGGSGYNGGAVGTCSATWRIGTDVFEYYGLSQATNQGADPHIYTTRLSNNGVYLMNVTTTIPSGGAATSVTYSGDIISCGITTRIYAVGAYVAVTILNAINDTVAYIGTNTTISVGACAGYSSDNRNVGIKVYVPTGTESY